MAISPLHPSMLEKLDPEYATFYNANLADKPGLHEIPWTTTLRELPPQPGGSDPVTVGAVRDIKLGKLMLRVFVPDGTAPENGWPALLYFHGGGWTLGNINTENAFASNVCKRANVVVVSVDYRLGPENPYPAAVEDAEAAFNWLFDHGAEELGANVKRIAVGGSSSGGNLAAILALKSSAYNPPRPLQFQLLIVPVTDNTADLSGERHASWKENEHAASLTPAKMMWFRKNYLPNSDDWRKWEASPLLAPEALYVKAPKAWIAVCELDILRDEGIAFGEKLKAAGVQVETRVCTAAPHPIMAMDGVLEIGRQLVTAGCEAVERLFRL